jgi:hypothetical protein
MIYGDYDEMPRTPLLVVTRYTTLAPPAFTLLSPYDRVVKTAVCVGVLWRSFLVLDPDFFGKKGRDDAQGEGKKQQDNVLFCHQQIL